MTNAGCAEFAPSLYLDGAVRAIRDALRCADEGIVLLSRAGRSGGEACRQLRHSARQLRLALEQAHAAVASSAAVEAANDK